MASYKVNRREVDSAALREYVARHAPDEVTQAVNEVVRKLGKRPTTDGFTAAAGRRAREFRDEAAPAPPLGWFIGPLSFILAPIGRALGYRARHDEYSGPMADRPSLGSSGIGLATSSTVGVGSARDESGSRRTT